MNDGFAANAHEAPPKPPSRAGVLGLALLALILCVALVVRISAERATAAQAREAIDDSFRRQIAVTDLLTGLADAESAQRGYVVTGNPVFLAPYEPARRELADTAAQLGLRYRDNAAQARHIDRLRAVIVAKFRQMDDVLRLRDTQGVAAATARIADQQGRQLMDQARAAANAFIVGERQSLTAANRVAEDRRHVIDFWLAIALFATVAALATALTVGWRGRMARYRLMLQSWDALARMHAVFASTRDAILLLNPSGSIEVVNAATTRMLGFEPHEVERRDVSALIDLAGGDGRFEERIGIVDGALPNPLRSGLAARHRDGHTVPVDVALGLMPLADGLHVVATLRDVSERREAERLKEEFVATVSHELRTPLTSVIGALGLLRSGTAGMLPEQAQRLADIAENNAHRLIRLINDILDIDRIGSGRITLDMAATDLTMLAARALDDAHGLAEARGVTLALDGGDVPQPVLGDSERLLQVIGNLLSNAIRFSPAGGTVRLATGMRGGRAFLSVSDQGQGVPDEFRDRLFQRFAQSRAGAAIPGGTGLGLAISQEIVKAHGGDVWYEPADGAGARFCLALDGFVARAAMGSDARRRILLCEDDGDAADMLGAMIEGEDIDIDRCTSAHEAHAMALSGRYDCVVLDLALPDADGLAAVRALRASGETRRLPVIVVSATAHAEGGSAATHALDVIDWIDKPVDRTRLLDALTVAIKRAADARPTLLHIDDDPDMLEVTAMALADRGRMLSATSLATARAMLADVTPDIVILDVNLPDGTGLELLPELYGPDGTAVPTIIYSATDMLPGMARPFDAVLVKSRRSLATLSETIKALLAKDREPA